MTWTQDLAHEGRTSHDEARLRELSTHRVTAVRAAVAANPAAPPDVLAKLVEDRHHLPRYAVAENASPAAIQLALSASRSDVRVMLAQRHDLDDDIYEILFADPSREVRESLATSTDQPQWVARFARSDERTLRAIAACHHLCGEEDFELLSRDPDNRVRAVVASMTGRLSQDMVQRLVRDRSANVRWHVLTHHPDRRDIAESLVEDPDTMNASQARTQLDDDVPDEIV